MFRESVFWKNLLIVLQFVSKERFWITGRTCIPDTELKRIIGRYTLTGCTQQLWRLASWVFVLGSRLSVLQGIVHSLTKVVCSCIPTCPFRAGLMTKRPDKSFLQGTAVSTCSTGTRASRTFSQTTWRTAEAVDMFRILMDLDCSCQSARRQMTSPYASDRELCNVADLLMAGREHLQKTP